VGLDGYKQGWKTLNRLLHEDRSFSGNERNSAFLNLGGSRFADLSAASGFGFFDDARAVATFDWDFDGDLDFWIANRTAPRIRFLKNNNDGDHHYLSLRLIGNGEGTNIDGIGARVKVLLKGASGGPSKKLIKTLYAGNGFLSQSSKWLHFGLGEADEIESLVIQWPGGSREVIKGGEVDQHYLLTQGSGKLTGFKPPGAERVESNTVVELPFSSDSARIVLPSRLPLPKLNYKTWNGEVASIAGPQSSPLLVNIWASWCQPCWAELAEWTDGRAAIKASGLRVIGLNVDEDGTGSGEKEIQSRLAKMGFPFEIGKGDRVLLNTLDAFQRGILDRWRPLPVPTSVLLDQSGRVAVIYRGPLSVEQLLEDLKLLEASPDALLEAAVPFEGHWFDGAPGLSPTSVSSRLIDISMVGPAARYLIRYGDQFTGAEISNAERLRVGDAYFTAAVLLNENKAFTRAAEILQKGAAASPSDLRIRSLLAEVCGRLGQWGEAEKHYGVVVKALPEDLATQRKLALVYLAQKKYSSALALLEHVTKAQPENALAHVDIASVWLGLKEERKAVVSYRSALSLVPNLPKALNNLAWILATHPDLEVRNGAEAIKYAERLCELSKHQSPVGLDTLATAYAEAGRFSDAVSTAQKAIGLVSPSANQAKILGMRKRLNLYKEGKPYRDQ
jgi:tetratricopeptide (TPR) repeat protein/thiol-disulfide isomerase/thioredoxin